MAAKRDDKLDLDLPILSERASTLADRAARQSKTASSGRLVAVSSIACSAPNQSSIDTPPMRQVCAAIGSSSLHGKNCPVHRRSVMSRQANMSEKKKRPTLDECEVVPHRRRR